MFADNLSLKGKPLSSPRQSRHRRGLRQAPPGARRLRRRDLLQERRTGRAGRRRDRCGGGTALAFKADAAVGDAAKAGVTAAVERLDILVNNAGIAAWPDRHAVRRRVRAAGDVNIRGVWHTTSCAIAYLGVAGRIINIGSFSERVPFPGSSAYGMTKHAVAGNDQGWARDLTGRGITANIVEPGPIETDANPDTGERSASIKTLVPLGRYGRPDEVAELVCFLASLAAAYITGTHILIDGGMLA